MEGIQGDISLQPVVSQGTQAETPVQQPVIVDNNSTLQTHPEAKTSSCCTSCWTALYRAFLTTVCNIWKGITIVFGWCCCCRSSSEAPFDAIKRDPTGFKKRYDSNPTQVQKELAEFVMKDPKKAHDEHIALLKFMFGESSPFGLDDTMWIIYGESTLGAMILKGLLEARRNAQSPEGKKAILEAFMLFAG